MDEINVPCLASPRVSLDRSLQPTILGQKQAHSIVAHRLDLALLDCHELLYPATYVPIQSQALAFPSYFLPSWSTRARSFVKLVSSDSHTGWGLHDVSPLESG